MFYICLFCNYVFKEEEQEEFFCPVCEEPIVAHTPDYIMSLRSNSLSNSIAAHAAIDWRYKDEETF